MTSEGMCTHNLILHHTELLGQCALQTSAVQSCQSGHLAGLQAAVQQGYQTCQVGRIEDNHHMLHIGAVGLDVLAQIFGNLAVACEQVLTCHAFLTGSTATGDDILCILESLCHVGGGSNVCIAESALAHFLGHTLGREYVIETNVRSEIQHECALHHV